MRVYPPDRSAYHGAIVANSLRTTSGRVTKRATCLRAPKSPRLAKVIMRSARRRVSLALATVVSIRSYWNSAVTRFRSSARRWEAVRLSFRWSLRCRMFAVPFAGAPPSLGAFACAVSGGVLGCLRVEPDRGLALVVLVDLHTERQSHLAQDVLDLLERLATEVAVLQHLRLALLDQVPDRLDLGRAQAVARAHRQLQLLDALVEQPP